MTVQDLLFGTRERPSTREQGEWQGTPSTCCHCDEHDAGYLNSRPHHPFRGGLDEAVRPVISRHGGRAHCCCEYWWAYPPL
jgi:hypothetical protein